MNNGIWFMVTQTLTDDVGTGNAFLIRNLIYEAARNFYFDASAVTEYAEGSWSYGSANAVAGLSTTRIALIRYSSGFRLAAYDYASETWTRDGSELALGAGMSFDARVVALSSTRVAILDRGEGLITYDFGGSSWSSVGNTAAAPSNGIYPGVAALSGSRIAIAQSGSSPGLRAYDFDGTDWAQVGNTLNITGMGAGISLAALSATRVAMVDCGNDELAVYDFDGTDWVEIGAAFSLGSLTQTNIVTGDSGFIVALSATTVLLAHGGNDKILAYVFNGDEWTQVGTAFTGHTIGTPIMAALDFAVAFTPA